MLKGFGAGFVALPLGWLGSDQPRLLVVGESFSEAFFKIPFRQFLQGFEALLITLGNESDNLGGGRFRVA